MLDDVVVDTNVLIDGSNASAFRYLATYDFLGKLLATSTKLRIDPVSRGNRGVVDNLILTEYAEKLNASMFGFYVLRQLAANDRISHVERFPEPQVRNRVRQLIRNRRDQTFLNVAIQSDDKILTSHDYEDFQAAKRTKIRQEFDVEIIEAGVCLQLL